VSIVFLARATYGMIMIERGMIMIERGMIMIERYDNHDREREDSTDSYHCYKSVRRLSTVIP
jgi:hypothetical protein